MLVKISLALVVSAIGMLIEHEHQSSNIAVIQGSMNSTTHYTDIYRTIELLDGTNEQGANGNAVSCTVKNGSMVSVLRIHEPNESRGQAAAVVVTGGEHRGCSGLIDFSQLSEPPHHDETILASMW